MLHIRHLQRVPYVYSRNLHIRAREDAPKKLVTPSTLEEEEPEPLVVDTRMIIEEPPLRTKFCIAFTEGAGFMGGVFFVGCSVLFAVSIIEKMRKPDE
jgi:hypothetical protein